MVVVVFLGGVYNAAGRVSDNDMSERSKGVGGVGTASRLEVAEGVEGVGKVGSPVGEGIERVKGRAEARVGGFDWGTLCTKVKRGRKE